MSTRPRARRHKEFNAKAQGRNAAKDGGNWDYRAVAADFLTVIPAKAGIQRAYPRENGDKVRAGQARTGGRMAGGSHSSLLTPHSSLLSLLSSLFSPISLLAKNPYCAKPLSPGTILASVREAPPFGVCRAGASSFFASRSDTARTAGGSHSSFLSPLSSPPHLASR